MSGAREAFGSEMPPAVARSLGLALEAQGAVAEKVPELWIPK